MPTDICRLAVALICASALAACGTTDFRLYDKARAESAAAIKANYAEADVVGIIGDQRKNLDALLAAELEIVRENQQLQLDISLLELADNDTPMADTWHEEVVAPMEALGFETASAARDFLIATDEVTVAERQMAGLARRMVKKNEGAPPACDENAAFDQDFKGKSRRHQSYADACTVWQQASQTLASAGGSIAAAQKRLLQAEGAKQRRASEVLAAKDAVADAKKQHAEAVKAVKDANGKAEEIRKTIKEESDRLQAKLAEAAEIAPSVVSEERVGAIVTLLKAAAGDETQVETDDNLAQATLLLGGVSSLAADVSGLVAKARAPSVSNLLIELQHQSVLLQHAKALEALEERRLAIRRDQLAGYIDEIDQLQQLRDAMCSFAYHMAAKGHPGTACDDFTVSDDGKDCTTGGAVPITVATGNCALGQPWKVHLKKPPSGDPNKNNATRELYKALAAYTRVFPMRAARLEQDFRIIDLQHRENLANREMALKAWNNLAAVPIDEIDAYYQAGIKPETLADLIVKALGFTAITVGVSQ